MCPPEEKQSTLDKEKQELKRKGVDRAHPVLSSLKASLSFLRCLSLLSCVGLNPQTVPPAQEWDREKQGPTGVLQLEELSRKSQEASPNCNPSDGGCELSPCEQMLNRDQTPADPRLGCELTVCCQPGSWSSEAELYTVRVDPAQRDQPSWGGSLGH